MENMDVVNEVFEAEDIVVEEPVLENSEAENIIFELPEVENSEAYAEEPVTMGEAPAEKKKLSVGMIGAICAAAHAALVFLLSPLLAFFSIIPGINLIMFFISPVITALNYASWGGSLGFGIASLVKSKKSGQKDVYGLLAFIYAIVALVFYVIEIILSVLLIVAFVVLYVILIISMLSMSGGGV